MNPRKKPLKISAEELSHMRNETYVWDVDLPSGVLCDDDMEVLEVKGTVTLARHKNLVQCTGDCTAQVKLTSDRTLDSFEVEIVVQFEEGLEIVDYYQLPETLKLSLEDAVEHIHEDKPIDLFELLRQHIILSLPMQKSEPGSCYNNHLSQYASADEENASADEEDVESAWDMIRKTVETWEKPSHN